MLALGRDTAIQFRDAVRAAAPRADVHLAVDVLYESLQDAIDLRRPVCNASGQCCRFEEFGHRLFVTTMELARFVSQRPEPEGPAWDGTGCRFQVGGMCSVHTIRPFGCRVFFCDETAEGWQREQYERFHGMLKRMHDELDVPYFYVEWREALACLSLPGSGGEECCLTGTSALTDRAPGGYIYRLISTAGVHTSDPQPRRHTMKKYSLALLFGLTGLSMVGCARPFEPGYTTAYTADERGKLIARNWDNEGKQIGDDLDHILLLRPQGHLSEWNLR